MTGEAAILDTLYGRPKAPAFFASPDELPPHCGQGKLHRSFPGKYHAVRHQLQLAFRKTVRTSVVVMTAFGNEA